MTSHARPSCNPSLTTAPFHGAETGERKTLMEWSVGRQQVRFTVPPHVAAFARSFDGEATIEQAAAAFAATPAARMTGDRYATLARRILLERGAILDRAAPMTEGDARRKARESYLFFRTPMVDPALVVPMTRAFGFLLTPVAAVAVGLAVAAAVAAFAGQVGANGLALRDLRLADAALITVFTLLSCAVHEIGHATAAVRFGASRVEIGWGVYLVYPVMYTDTSDAWRCTRRQRVIIDLAGVYFQSTFLVGGVALFFATGDQAYLQAVAFVMISILTSLNPVIKLDGYWVFSDAFGLANLRDRQAAWVARLLKRVVRRDADADAIQDMSAHARKALAWYSSLGAVLYLLVIGTILVTIVRDVALPFAGRLEASLAAASGGPSGAAAAEMGEVLLQAVILTAFALLCFRLGRNAVRGAAFVRRTLAS